MQNQTRSPGQTQEACSVLPLSFCLFCNVRELAALSLICLSFLCNLRQWLKVEHFSVTMHESSLHSVVIIPHYMNKRSILHQFRHQIVQTTKIYSASQTGGSHLFGIGFLGRIKMTKKKQTQ